MSEIIIIAAMSENRVIGKNNALPWSIKEDLAHLRKLTNGWPCIMGRKTWDSLPKPMLWKGLPIIISGTLTLDEPNAKTFPSLPAAIEHCSNYEKIFVCGGGEIYRQAMPLANKIELTLIHRHYEGDAFFPEIDNSWTKTQSLDFDTFSFITYTRAT
ncbi:MAG: dihydrofolate reductase [Treponema sp.]|nr:dihydrofolate reductase [Treponema sp.]